MKRIFGCLSTPQEKRKIPFIKKAIEGAIQVYYPFFKRKKA
jgi:hypothetical protein